jgi:signal transduction histidine kinase
VTASSGCEALRILLTIDFALILMEAELPGMNGFETAIVIKTREKSKNTPIILMSANHNEQFIYQGYGVGAVDYLLKPFDPYILRSKVSNFVDMYRKNQLCEKEAIETRNEFLSLASHELNTPITSLKLQLQMIKKSLENGQDGILPIERFSKGVEASCRQVDRLINLIQIFLDVSRIQAGDLTYYHEDFNIQGLISEVLNRYTELLNHTDCTINVINEIQAEVRWDKTRINHVLTNLLTNAIKYAPGHIDLIVEDDEEMIKLTVKDYGPGIAETKLTTIFDRYERATSDTNISGLGLGLFVVKQIVEGHNGKIEVKSALGEGTSFFVYLPKDASVTENHLH